MDRETEGTGGQVFTGEESTPLWAHRDLLEGGDRHRGLGEGLGTPPSDTSTSLCPLGRGHRVKWRGLDSIIDTVLQ